MKSAATSLLLRVDDLGEKPYKIRKKLQQVLHDNPTLETNTHKKNWNDILCYMHSAKVTCYKIGLGICHIH